MELKQDIWLIMILIYFFVVYLAYVNLLILDKKYFELILKMMDQGILKNIFLTSNYQIPKNFPKN